MTTVSILIPVYNEIRFIGKTLQSVIGEADEIILCDNASTDGTSEICSAYAARHQEINYTRHARNLGAGANFNECLSRATGRYIRFMGGHDMVSRFSTQSMLELMRSTPDAGLVYPGFVARLNADYTIARFSSSCDFADDLKSPSPFRRTLSAIEKLSDCFQYYGLYDAQLLRALIAEYGVFSFFSDYAAIVGMAGGRTILADNTSIYFAMEPRDSERNAREMFQRIARMISGGTCDNPFLWLFTILCEGHEIIGELQSRADAPPDFSRKAWESLLKRFGTAQGVRVSRDGFPAVLPGREALADEVFRIALENESKVLGKERAKFKNMIRLAAHSILTKMPPSSLAAPMRLRLEKKLRSKCLID